MSSAFDSPILLAPLQRIMLSDSVAGTQIGVHVEQVVIVFSGGIEEMAILSAWETTVEQTEALQLGLILENGRPAGWKRAHSPRPAFSIESCEGDFEEWLQRDRERVILIEGNEPWRVAWFRAERRLVWTFHHALLDGRSITAVIRAFLAVIRGDEAKALPLSRWQAPDDETRDAAREHFTRFFADPVSSVDAPPSNPATKERAVRRLGSSFADMMESLAREWGVSTTALLIQAWSQAVAEASGTDAIAVEQIRSGPPQVGTAGFFMNTLPVMVRRFPGPEPAEHLKALRRQLLDLRKIESISEVAYPETVASALQSPWSSVIMVERGTLRFMVEQEGAFPFVESLDLHEHRGRALTAAVYLQPDFLMIVEGPGRFALLDRWIEILEWMAGRASHG